MLVAARATNGPRFTADWMKRRGAIVLEPTVPLDRWLAKYKKNGNTIGQRSSGNGDFDPSGTLTVLSSSSFIDLNSE